MTPSGRYHYALHKIRNVWQTFLWVAFVFVFLYIIVEHGWKDTLKGLLVYTAGIFIATFGVAYSTRWWYRIRLDNETDVDGPNHGQT